MTARCPSDLQKPRRKHIRRLGDATFWTIVCPIWWKTAVKMPKRLEVSPYGLSLCHPDGYDFTNYSFGINDLAAMCEVVLHYKMKTMLEIGSGLSTLLMSQILHVDSLENHAQFAEKVESRRMDRMDFTLISWDGVNWPTCLADRYDCVFIDGPELGVTQAEREWYTKKGVFSREPSFVNAPDLTDHIFVHDASWYLEAIAQITHIAPWFNLVRILKSDNDPDIRRHMTYWVRSKPRGT